jgi:hypothetical protein
MPSLLNLFNRSTTPNKFCLSPGVPKFDNHVATEAFVPIPLTYLALVFTYVLDLSLTVNDRLKHRFMRRHSAYRGLKLALPSLVPSDLHVEVLRVIERARRVLVSSTATLQMTRVPLVAD